MRNLDSKVRWSKDAQRQFWNDWDRKFLASSTIGEQATRRAQAVLTLLGNLRLTQNPRILEIGCGNGWFAKELTYLGAVTAIDIADEAVHEARRLVENVDFIAGDFSDLDMPADAFDVVVSMETYSHVPQREFLSWIARVLKPGGYVVLTTQNRSVYARTSWVKPPAEGQVRRWVTPRELREALRREYEVLDCFTIEPGGDMGLLRLVNSRLLNRALGLLIPPAKIRSAKEKLGFGQTIVSLAQRVPRAV